LNYDNASVRRGVHVQRYRSVYMYVLRQYKVQLARKYLVTIIIRPMCHGNLR